MSFYSNAKIILISLVNFSKNDPKKSNKIEEEFEIDQNRLRPDTPLGFDAFYMYVSHHERLISTALVTWKQNKIFGNGIKSFREDCHRLRQQPDVSLEENLYPDKKNRLCSNHPHNYYFELLTETGILGLSVIAIIGLIFTGFFALILNFFFPLNDLFIYINFSCRFFICLVIPSSF